jgi:hypothetical protein
MKPDTFTVAEAAKLVGIEPGRLRGWMQHRHIEFGTKGRTGRYRFSLRDVRAIALIAKLVDHGIEPGVAARQSASIVDRVANWKYAPLAAIFSRRPNVSPCLVPADDVPPADAVIVIPLVPLWRRFGGAA